jgi:2-oxo-4-hydroxy-4-carboxy-5-ureidoimidazoline decarboxylase
MTLAGVNALERDPFVAALGWIFEESPWVAERAWSRRPFASRDALHCAMVETVEAAAPSEQLALLRAHPDLGALARVSHASQAEQSDAGLNDLTPDEFDRLTRSNAAYRARFEFPFLYAVRGSTKHDILRAIEWRLGQPREAEYVEALRQVYRIAMFRLEDAIS